MKHGIVKGTILGATRISRCSGAYRGGIDRVPERFRMKRIAWRYRRFGRKRDRS